MNGNLWIVSVLVVMLTVGAVAIPAQIADETIDESVEDEEQTLDNRSPITLDNAGQMVSLDTESVNVTSTDGSTIYEEGEDYELIADRAQLQAIDETLNQSTVNVDYEYQAYSDERTGEIAALFNLIDPIFGWVIILSIFGALFAMLGWW